MAQVITESLLKKLLVLESGQSLKGSECKGELFQDLIKENLLFPVPCGRGFNYCASDKDALQSFLSTYDDRLKNIEGMLEILKSQENDEEHAVVVRASQALITGNSKLVKTRSCKGFLVNSFEHVECSLNGKSFLVNPPEGSYVFVTDCETFVPPANAIIVGVENMENFHFINRQKNLFKEISTTAPLIFVSRYPQSKDLVRWLQQIPNHYVHFGDLDLAGIHIYLTEFFAHLGSRASFLIPSDAEERIANGSLERYDDQVQRFEKMNVADERVLSLIKLIKKYHRGYDQEGFIV